MIAEEFRDIHDRWKIPGYKPVEEIPLEPRHR
jgi:hypothetical protein